MIKLSWEELKEITIQVARRLRGENIVVIGVGYSGLIPAALLCRYILCRKFLTVFIKKYGEGKPPRRIYDKPKLVLGFSGKLAGETVVIVDDIAVTGETLTLAKSYVKQKGGGRVYTFAVAKKPGVNVDFYGFETEECIVFPWE